MIEPITVPSSKSYTQRAMVLAALARGVSIIERPADCDDTRLLRDALASLGVGITWSEDHLEIDGGDLAAPRAPVFLGNAGTAVRFVAGLSLLIDGCIEVRGVEAMSRRPMPGLLAALRSMGVGIEELGRPSCPPLRFHGPGSPGPEVAIDPTGSSQQVSALLLVAPRLGLTVRLSSAPPSRPYIEMTLASIRAFGGVCGWQDEATLRVEPGGIEPTQYTVEADYSAAAMVLAGGWITGRQVTIRGLDPCSLQGDRVFASVLDSLDGPGPRTFDLRDAPDVVPPTVAAALFARGETRIDGVSHLRIKECDRVEVLASELARIGARIDSEQDSMTVRPGPLGPGARLDPHGDHRMAMAFGLVGLRVPGIEVMDPGCVSKSFPDFWDVLERLR
jgi:3-phosphoshikimate 1-carboxyvinyltransferase